MSPQDLLQFWFHPERQAHWFKSTPELDREIGARFGALWQRGRDGELAHWEATPEGALALVILLDQFPLNMFRGRSEGFATEASSRAVAARAIERGLDQAHDDQGKAVLCMPFMHSETPADQERSLALLAAAGLNANLKWARHHRDIVHRFGRFPHRNAILGRRDTAEETEWLASPDAFRG